VMPAVEQAEGSFSTALARINIEDLAHSAAALPTQEPDRTDSILTEPDSVRQSRARDRRVTLTEIGRLLKDQYNALASPVPPHRPWRAGRWSTSPFPALRRSHRRFASCGITVCGPSIFVSRSSVASNARDRTLAHGCPVGRFRQRWHLTSFVPRRAHGSFPVTEMLHLMTF
jgi:hypothetical protein